MHAEKLDTIQNLLQTTLGKLFAGLCALVGIFLLTLPLPIVVNSFAGFYKNRLWRNEVALKKRDRMRQRGEARARRQSSVSRGQKEAGQGGASVPRHRYGVLMMM